MGFRFSKSIRLGKFIRLNVSRAGLGGSIGVGPFRVGVGPRGTRFTADLPGAGTSYVKQWGGGSEAKSAGERRGAKKSTRSRDESETETAREAVEIPSPGLFAPGSEKE